MARPGATRLSLNNLLLSHNLPSNAVRPKPETRNLKPETRNPKPETRDPKPETRNQVRDKAVYEANERFWAVRPLTPGTLYYPAISFGFRGKGETTVIFPREVKSLCIQCAILSLP